MLFANKYGSTCIGQFRGEEAGFQHRRTGFLKILLVNQAFWPDTVSSGQHAADLAVALVAAGHSVTVLTGRRGYDRPRVRFPRRETWRNVEILRIGATGFGKGASWRRMADFGSFLLYCGLRLFLLPRFDLTIAMTSPPLVSALAASAVRLKGGSLVCWVLDLNPDEAIVAGWLRADSWAGRMLRRIAAFSFATAKRIVAMDRFMADRIATYGVPREKIAVISPWSHDDAIRYDVAGREAFRHEHGLDGRFVVMYSGNHSPCHPLDTLLEAARCMKNDARVAFCFVGGGSEFARVKAYAEGHRLRNILCLPYVPMERLAGSLSAADLHTVVMGDPYVGVVHPGKIYNILALGIPFLYIGPERGHIPDLMAGASPEWTMHASHGDTDAVVEQIRRATAAELPVPQPAEQALARQFSQHNVIPSMLESLGLANTKTSICTP